MNENSHISEPPHHKISPFIKIKLHRPQRLKTNTYDNLLHCIEMVSPDEWIENDNSSCTGLKYTHAAIALATLNCNTSVSSEISAIKKRIKQLQKNTLFNKIITVAHDRIATDQGVTSEIIISNCPIIDGIYEYLTCQINQRFNLSQCPWPIAINAGLSLSISSFFPTCTWLSPLQGLKQRHGVEIKTVDSSFRIQAPWDFPVIKINHKSALNILNVESMEDKKVKNIVENIEIIRESALKLTPSTDRQNTEYIHDLAIYEYSFNKIKESADIIQLIKGDPLVTLVAATAYFHSEGKKIMP